MTELVPMRSDLSYLLSWFIAETVPKDDEEWANNTMREHATEENPTPYISPPKLPADMTFAQRISLDQSVNEHGDEVWDQPLHHDGTGVDSDEVQYESHLLPIAAALTLLRGTTMEYVVRKGWDLILARSDRESSENSTSGAQISGLMLQ